MTPFLSIVVTGRHDNYGGDFNERFFCALSFNMARLAERGVATELVFTEWNPIAGRPFLAQLLGERFGTVVPAMQRWVAAPEYHAAFTQNPQLAYLEYIAKNIGLRRANGRFVLMTNTDVLLGRHVVETIASGCVAPGVIHRAPRYDLKLGLDQSRLSWDALEDPANHVRRPVLKPPLYNGGSGDFVLADCDTFFALGGYNEVYRAARAGLDVNFLAKAHGAGVPIADTGGPVYHINHVGSLRLSKALYRDSPADTPWGNLRWHSRHVTYNNPDGWGLRDAPVRRLADGTMFLEFDWRVVPPLIELRRIVLPAARNASEPI